MGTVEHRVLPQKSKGKNVSPIVPLTALKNQKASRGRGSACAAGICSGVRKSQRSEAPEDGSGEVQHALSLRSAELGIDQQFPANRSGARPPGLRNAESVFENSFLQSARPTLQEICPKISQRSPLRLLVLEQISYKL